MADSVGSHSLYGTSDVLVDPYCDPCFNKDGVTRQAIAFCTKCIEFYCKSCLESHDRIGITKQHKILRGSDMPSSHADKPIKYCLCEHHDEQMDQYCLDHCVVLCKHCVVRKHKKCEVKSVEEVSKYFNLSTEEETFSRDVRKLLEYTRNIKKTLKENINNLEKEKLNSLQEAKNIRDKLIKEINTSYEEFSANITKLSKHQTTSLCSYKSTIEDIETDIEVISNSLQQTQSVSRVDPKFFLDLLLYSDKIVFYDEKIKNLNLTSVSLKSDFSVQPPVKSEQMFGEVSVQMSDFKHVTQLPEIHQPFRRREKGAEGGRGAVRAEGGGTLMPVKLTRSGEINVRRTDDRESCFISGIDTTSNGNLILTDYSNSKVKLFSPNGQFLSSFSPSGLPLDVSVVDLSTAAVSVTNNREIVILGLGRGDQLSHRDTISLQRYVWGIQSYNNNLIITCDTSGVFPPRSVEMINMKGQVLWSTASHPNPLFDGARFLTVRSGSGPDSVIISDYRKQTITVLEADSGNLVKVCNVRGRWPLGLTLDDNGNTYVCYPSGDVSVWSGNMDVETSLSLQGGLVSKPGAMVYSSRRQEIILTNNSDLIYCYKMLTWRSAGNMETVLNMVDNSREVWRFIFGHWYIAADNRNLF